MRPDKTIWARAGRSAAGREKKVVVAIVRVGTISKEGHESWPGQRSDGGMGSRQSSELFGHLDTLFRVGVVGGLSDAQLLERFVAGRDEAGEAAFRALVERHGPMVLRVCRSVLAESHDAEDAFQVTFLALATRPARSANTVRLRAGCTGPPSAWPEGQHRGQAGGGRESHGVALAAEAAVSGDSEPSIEDHELSPILHEEIERLPAKYRAPIVLCYLEGMTQDQAAVDAGLAGRDGPGPAGAGTRPPEVAPHSPWPDAFRRACGLCFVGRRGRVGPSPR